MKTTYFLSAEGRLENNLLFSDVEVPEEVSLLATSTSGPTAAIAHYYVRFNHEIFVEISERAYQTLEQHIEFSQYVADQKIAVEPPS
jgi:hypothetical protein